MRTSLLIIIGLLTGFVLYGQNHVSTVIDYPHEAPFLLDIGYNIVGFGNDFIIQNELYVEGDENGFFENIGVTSRISEEGDIEWSSKFIFDEVDRCFGYKESVLVDGDAIYSGYMCQNLEGNRYQSKYLSIVKLSDKGHILDTLLIPAEGKPKLINGIHEIRDNLIVIADNRNNDFDLYLLDKNLNILKHKYVQNQGVSYANGFNLKVIDNNEFIVSSKQRRLGEELKLTFQVFNFDLDQTSFFSSYADYAGNIIGSHFYPTDERKIVSVWTYDNGDIDNSAADFKIIIFNSDFTVFNEYVLDFKYEMKLIDLEVKDEYIYLLGNSQHFGGYKGLQYISTFIAKFSISDGFVWERNIMDNRRNEFLAGNSLIITPEDDIAITGIEHYRYYDTVLRDEYNTFLLTIDTEGCWNGHCEDEIIIINDSTAITTKTALEEGMKNYETIIYPNPSSGDIYLEHDYLEAVEVVIYDPYGRIIIRKICHDSSFHVSLRDYNPGIYILNLMSSDGKLLSTEKFILLGD